MTEAEWQSCEDPAAALGFLAKSYHHLSARKLRLAVQSPQHVSIASRKGRNYDRSGVAGVRRPEADAGMLAECGKRPQIAAGVGAVSFT
jgi:hypothetical protein